MKKGLSVFMALALILVMLLLGACSTQESNPGDVSPSSDVNGNADTPDDSQQQDDSGVVEPSDEGYSIIWCSATWDEEFLVQMGDSVEKLWHENGGTLERVGSDGDLATQISQIENAIVMGYDQIIVGGPDNQSLENVVGEAMDAGIQVIVFGQSEVGYPVSGTCNTSGLNVGTAQGNMALAWVDSRYPDAPAGSVKAALTTYDGNSESKNRTQGMENTVFADERVENVYTQDTVMTVDAGYTFASEALTYDPDIRLFMCFTNGCAIGISNYVISEYGDAGEFDVTQWAAFGGDRSDAALEMIDQAKENGDSIVRGIIYNGDPEESGRGVFTVSYALLTGEHEEPYYFLDPEHTYNSFGFEL